jgi:hypothetical protein
VERIDDLRWRKSSYSGNGGADCVELASHDGHVLVRDTKEHGNGRVHRFGVADWRAFIARLKADR